MEIDISKLPPGFKLEMTKENLISFADRLMESRYSVDGLESIHKGEEKPLNIEEIASLINVSKQHVYFLTSKKQIPHVKKGKRLYFYKSEILQWLKEGEQKTDKEIDDMANEYLEKTRTKSK